MRGSILSADHDTVIAKFKNLQTTQDIADLFEISLDDLHYYLYRPKLKKYRQFCVKKRAGGIRTLSEPIIGLKIIQKKLSYILNCTFRPRPSVQGFVLERSIATNAQLHEGKQYLLSLDLENFFPSINFGRVRGLFLAYPFHFSPTIATVLAQICCFDNQLPQGAPTSPIISNMICSRLDGDMQKLASRRHCIYSRYADDITFSTSEKKFPSSLAIIDNRDISAEIILGDELEKIITQNGFRVNYGKTRLHNKKKRLEVTGLIVNDKVNVPRKYVRQIRAMLHAWRKFGLEAAESTFQQNYDKKDRNPSRASVSFPNMIKGKLNFLAMIRGHDDPLYRKLLHQYADLDLSYNVPAIGKKINHLGYPKDAIWILESTLGQGTGFVLQGYGLVTCAHVIKSDLTFAFRQENPERRYLVSTKKIDKNLDLAILDFTAKTSYEFTLAQPYLKIGDSVKIVGFPQWSLGATLSETTGQICGFRKWHSNSRALVSCKIVEGASGSPVLDAYNRVIGIAAHGAASFQEADSEASDDFGIIFISDLDKLT